MLSEYSDFSKNCVWQSFFNVLRFFLISLITRCLSSYQKFRLFAIGKKSLEVLNFYFGRKYHFVKSKKSIFNNVQKNNFSNFWVSKSLLSDACMQKTAEGYFFEHYYITKFLMKYYIIPNRTAPIASNLSRSNWSAIRFLYSINELFAIYFIYLYFKYFLYSIWQFGGWLFRLALPIAKSGYLPVSLSERSVCEVVVIIPRQIYTKSLQKCLPLQRFIVE